MQIGPSHNNSTPYYTTERGNIPLAAVICYDVPMPELLPDVSPRRVRLAYWWVSHRAQLKTSRALFLLVVDALFLLFILYSFVVYVMSLRATTAIQQSLIEQAINFEAYRSVFGARQPEIRDPILVRIPGGGGVMLVEVNNINTYWGGDPVVLDVKIGGETVGTIETFFLPKEKRFAVLELSAKDAERSGGFSVSIQEWGWQRVQHPDTFPIPSFTVETPIFSIVTSQARPELRKIFKESDTSSKQYSSVKATVRNASLFGFRNAAFTALVYSGESIVAVKRTTVDEFPTQSEKTIEFLWPQAYAGVSRIEVVPEVNTFRESNLIRRNETDVPLN